MEDNNIIDLFFNRSDSAISELSRKYEKICMRISMNVLGSVTDAEECLNDAYLTLWNTIPPEKPNPLIAYLCRVVRNISINKYKYNTMKKRNSQYNLCMEELEYCISDTATVEDEVCSMELSESINAFIESLSETNRLLFVRRYWFMDSYEELSSATGLKEGAIRTRIARMKQALRDYLIKEGMVYEK